MTRQTRTASTFVLTLAALAVSASAGAADGPHTEILADGTELIVAPLRGTRSVAFRYLVHSGSTADPTGKDGLAHLLEHAVFHGNARVEGDRIFRLARQLGTELNAFTSQGHTVYVLNGPKRAVEAMLPTYVDAVTSPAFPPERLEAERAVVFAEATLRPAQSMYGVITQLLMPGIRSNLEVIGTQGSLYQVTRQDLVDFYREHYRPANTTILVTGHVAPEEMKALLEASSRLAPNSDSAAPRVEQDVSLNIPAHVRVPAAMYMTLSGFDLGGVDRTTCRALAALVELRVKKAVDIERPMASGVGASCVLMRGRQLLVALAPSRSYEGSSVPDALDRVFRGLRTSPMNAAERGHLNRRAAVEVRRMREDPAALADALVLELVSARARGDRSAVFDAVLEPLHFDAIAMRQAAEKCFVPERRIQIEVGPF